MMSFDVKFFTVAKRKNSTFRPLDTDVKYTASCNLKESSGVLNPTISLSFTMDSKPMEFNYAYISEFDRYYYITDWEYSNRLWYAHLEVDALSTYKTTIENRSYYILRCSAKKDEQISDTLYPIKGHAVRTIIDGDNLWGSAESGWANGTFIVGLVGQDGLTDYFAMGLGQFQKFAKAMFERCDWLKSDGGGLSAFGDDVIKAVVNPAQYVTSVMWLPPGLSPGGTDMVGINLGWWSLELPTGMKKTPSDSLRVHIQKTITPTNHTQYEKFGAYVNNYPFRKICLYVPVFGSMWLDSSKIRAGESVIVDLQVDFRTGLGYLQVMVKISDFYCILETRYAQVGIPLQVSDLKTDILSSIGNTIGAVGSQLSGNYLGVGLGVGSALADAISPEVTTMGSPGSTCNIGGKIKMMVYSYEQAEHDNSHQGSPLCEHNTMKTIGAGYYVVSDGSTPLNGAYTEEIDAVTNYLESGVYYA